MARLCSAASCACVGAAGTPAFACLQPLAAAVHTCSCSSGGYVSLHAARPGKTQLLPVSREPWCQLKGCPSCKCAVALLTHVLLRLVEDGPVHRDEQGVLIRICDGLAAITVVYVPVQDQHLVVLLHRTHLSGGVALLNVALRRSSQDTQCRTAGRGAGLCACRHAVSVPA